MGYEKEILDTCHVVAIVGLSSKEDRPSNHVGSYLQEAGYRIVPVNPAEKEILGEVCYPNLTSIPEKIDVVDIFRRSEDVLPIVEEAISIGARAVWMQEGVVNDDAARKAMISGLKVVMDRCIKKEHARLHADMG
jgi:uncharacterized protein